MADKLQSDINRAARAEALNKDELLNEAFAELEAKYVEAWRTTRPTEEKAREKLYLAVNVARKVRDHLTKVINDGAIAKAELKRLTGA